MNTALLLIDIQKDYFPHGRMELSGAVEAGLSAQRLLKLFREKELPVIHIQHISTRKGATFFLPGTDGAEFHESVMPLPGETVIVKHFPNSFRETPLDGILKALSPQRLVVCGMMSHMCVDATVRAAFDLGYECLVAHDACATRDVSFNEATVAAKDVHAAFMASLDKIYAQVLSAGQILHCIS